MNVTQEPLDVFRNLYANLNKVCFTIISIDIYILNISLVWAIYFIYEIVMEKKYLKRLNGEQKIYQYEEWLNSQKNSLRKLVKIKFLLAISFLEWLFVFILTTISSINIARDLFSVTDIHIPQIRIYNLVYLQLSATFLTKIIISFAIVWCLFILCLLRILTEYLLHQYESSSTTWEFSPIFIRLAIRLAFIFILGLPRTSIILQWIAAAFSFFFEVYAYTRATKRLCICLRNRYLDAKYREYQPKYVIQYYKRASRDFKFGSYIIRSSLFLHLLGFTIFVACSIISFIQTYPHDWIKIIFHAHEGITPINEAYVEIFGTGYIMITLVLETMGWTVMVIPYLLVSARIIIVYAKSSVNKGKHHPNTDLTRKLLEDNNNCYYDLNGRI